MPQERDRFFDEFYEELARGSWQGSRPISIPSFRGWGNTDLICSEVIQPLLEEHSTRSSTS